MGQEFAAFSASLTASAQASADFSVPCPTRLMTFSTASRVGPFFLPRYCGFRFSAVEAKIWPVGALVKNSFL
jgi:hypothetical protein